jgi:two-component system NtrC family sensor kinase
MKRYWFSLRIIISVTVIFAVALASAIAYVDQASRIRALHETQIRGELERMATLTAMAMREALWQYVPEQVESIIDSVFVAKEVQMVEVLDHRDGVFAKRQRNAVPSSDDEGELVEKVLPIERNATAIGQLRIVISTSGYQQKWKDAQETFLRGVGVVLLIAVIITLVVLQWGLVRPIKALVRESQLIAQGDLRHPIQSLMLTELGTLAMSMETTRLSLQKLISELEERNVRLNEANELLEARVAERTRTLEQTLEQLRYTQGEMIQSEKLASLGRVVAGVAHELNTPIGNALTVASTVASHLENLNAELSTGTLKKSTLMQVTENSRQALSIFLRNIEKAAQLVTSFKQVAVDQASDQRRSYDLAQVATEVLSTVHPAVRKANCQVETDFQDSLICDGYPGSVGQVLSNLVVNALVHAYPGGAGGLIRVSVKAADVAGYVNLLVSDEGEGMTPEVVNKIFDPFFTTKLGTGGSGLGMNIVQGLVVRTLGGTVSVHSAPSKGTTIRVQFPLVAPMPGAKSGMA